MTVADEDNSSKTNSLQAEAPIVLVLLGASNLARGCFALGRHIQDNLYPRSVEVMTAAGPGRGYCVVGGLLMVRYQPIRSSLIFEAAQKKAATGHRVIALITDIGNDIMYGVPARELIDTIQQVFIRLQAMNAEIFFTTLPKRFEGEVSPIWYYLLRTILMPGSRVSHADAISGIAEVNRFLRESACSSIHRIAGMDSYLGLDEIHYSLCNAHRAWTHVARAMLGTLGMKTTGSVSRSQWIKSCWQGFRKLVWSDILKAKNIKSNIY